WWRCGTSNRSYIPEQDLHTPQADHTEEVLDVVLPANHEPTKMMEPSEKSFHTPTSAVATKRTAVLGRCPAHSAMRSDHLNAVALEYDPIGRCHRLCRRSVALGGFRGNCARGALRQVGFRAAKRFRYLRAFSRDRRERRGGRRPAVSERASRSGDSPWARAQYPRQPVQSPIDYS